MISVNNYVYTNKGIYSVGELYDLYTKSLIPANGIVMPEVMTYNINTFNYIFTDINKVVKTETKENFVDMYEVRMLDIFSNRNITINCNEDTQLLQYNVILTDINPIEKRFIGVNRYLDGNKSRSKINIGWKSISDMYNYATKMPCIGLGDTIIRYMNKLYKKKEPGYAILDSANQQIPIFVCMNSSTFYNFVLIK